MLLHQRFVLKKTFTRVAALTELQESLDREFLYAELIQWMNPTSRGIILATFETSLTDLLYPAPCFKGLLAGVDVDLLMDATRYFPGIIAPKIEISTKTVIEEVLGVYESCLNGPYVVNPKTVNSKHISCPHRKRPAKGIIRQRRVCHTRGKPRTQICRRCNPETVEKSEPDKCYHASNKKANRSCGQLAVKQKDCQVVPSACTNVHKLDNCPVCLKYKCYFSGKCDDEPYAGNTAIETRINDIPKEIRSVKQLRDSEGFRRFYEPVDTAPYPSGISASASRSMNARRSTEHRHEGNDPEIPDVSDCNCCCECDEDATERGFYKNLVKFYKRMYKQAKLRAREADV